MRKTKHQGSRQFICPRCSKTKITPLKTAFPDGRDSPYCWPCIVSLLREGKISEHDTIEVSAGMLATVMKRAGKAKA